MADKFYRCRPAHGDSATRALQRIETVSYTMDKIISGERENPILPKLSLRAIAFCSWCMAR